MLSHSEFTVPLQACTQWCPHLWLCQESPGSASCYFHRRQTVQICSPLWTWAWLQR